METAISSTLQNADLLNSNYDEDGTYYPESDVYYGHDIAPPVMMELVWNSSISTQFMEKIEFLDRYGVQEYYLYDIERKQLSGFIRFQERDIELEEIPDMNGWTSPRLGIRFDMSSGELVLRKPDGEPFLSYAEVEEVLQERTRQLEQAQVKLEQTQIKLSASESRAAILAEKLRELGINPDAL